MLPQYPRFSVIIICAARRKHLFWTLRACLKNNKLPTEIIVIHMDDMYEFYSPLALIKQFRIPKKDGELNLAGARNLGANKATTNQLIFLDVDCIPNTYCFERILNSLSSKNVVQGTPKYLTKSVTNLKCLNLKSIYHPLKPPVKTSIREKDYNQFWSLIFGIKRSTFLKLGGFHENYQGYGAEDTDLGQKFEMHTLNLYRANAIVYHQYHQVYRPPLNHFLGIVRNAQVFYDRWGFMPMMNWIEKFKETKLVEINNGQLKVLRLPTSNEIEEAKSCNAF
ncbi:glycosyltransferase family 2 protein [Zunongwangia atlantica]|uniref:Glycosyl transferase n=1 Tax=Zunongwangia atlantica 22II14-10F7 TaxID=1185767 RepID=A0A1Y1SYQ0_9FLAO|nr:galactosyltransferase-related protein [Zunongwangia atlantica]ORL43877.1 glycosyl transferase [Zunongwangia atlantica 22II14-10F7]